MKSNKTNQGHEMSTSLVLSLQRDSQQRNYYVLAEKRKGQLILMEEYAGTDASDNYTVFHSWDEALKDLSKFEGSIAGEKRWWSYCPGWMYFNPAFIHQGLKQVFSKLIVQSLGDVVESDVVKEEKERFSIWAKICNASMELKMIN